MHPLLRPSSLAFILSASLLTSCTGKSHSTRTLDSIDSVLTAIETPSPIVAEQVK